MNNYSTNPQEKQEKKHPFTVVKQVDPSEIILPGLLIKSHRTIDKASKIEAMNTLKGWQRREMPLPRWFHELEQGSSVIIADMKPRKSGGYTHAKDLCNSNQLILFDADNIVGVEFTSEGKDDNPNGVKPFTDPAELFLRYPALEQVLFCKSESVSSMSEHKPHLRYRAGVLADRPLINEEEYNDFSRALKQFFKIFSQDERSPAQPVFGNARENGKVQVLGNMISAEATIKLGKEIKEEAEEQASHTTQHEIYQNKQTPPRKQTDTETYDGPKDITLDGFLRHHHIAYEADTKESEKYFVRCPYGNDHTDGICNPKDSYVFVNEVGKFAYHCSHTSCKSSGRTTWKAFKAGHGIREYEPREHRKRTGRIRKTETDMDIATSRADSDTEPPATSSVARAETDNISDIHQRLRESFSKILTSRDPESDKPRVHALRASTGFGKSTILVDSIAALEKDEGHILLTSRTKELRDQQHERCVDKLGEEECQLWQGRDTGFRDIKHKTRQARTDKKNFEQALCPMLPEWKLAREKGIHYCKYCPLVNVCHSDGYLNQHRKVTKLTNIALGGALNYEITDFENDLKTAAGKEYQLVVIDDYTLGDLILPMTLRLSTVQTLLENADKMETLAYQARNEEQDERATDFEAFVYFLARLENLIQACQTGAAFRSGLTDYLDPDKSIDSDRVRKGSRLFFNDTHEETGTLETPGDAFSSSGVGTDILKHMPPSYEGTFERLESWFEQTHGQEAIAFKREVTEDGDIVVTLSMEPQLTTQRDLLLMSGTTDPEDARVCLPDDIDFRTHSLPTAENAPGVLTLQYQDAKFTVQSLIGYDKNGNEQLTEQGKRLLTDIADKAEVEKADRLEADLPAESLFVSYKEFNDPDSPIFHTPEVQRVHKTFETVSHFGAIAGLNLKGYGIFVIVGYPRIPHEDVRNRTMHMYHIDIGDYEQATEEREQEVKNVQGVDSEFGIFYKDKRAQRAHDSFALAELQQAAGRSRPAIWPDTVTVIYSGALIESSPSRAEAFFSKEDFAHATSFSGIPDAMISRKADLIKAEVMARMGASIRAISTDCKISVWQARKIIAEIAEESNQSEKCAIPKKNTGINIGTRAPVDNPENMPDETTSPLETELRKTDANRTSQTELPANRTSQTELPETELPEVNGKGNERIEKMIHHKDVAGQILEFLSDGSEKKTSEIKQAVTASHRAIEKMLKKLVEQGLIIKVRHGTYRKSPTPEPLDDPEPSTPGDTSESGDTPMSKESDATDKPNEPRPVTEPSKEQPNGDGTSSGDRAEKSENDSPAVIDASKDDSIFSHPPPVDTEPAPVVLTETEPGYSKNDKIMLGCKVASDNVDTAGTSSGNRAEPIDEAETPDANEQSVTVKTTGNPARLDTETETETEADTESADANEQPQGDTEPDTESQYAIECDTPERLVRVWVNPIGHGRVSIPDADFATWTEADVVRDLPSYAGGDINRSCWIAVSMGDLARLGFDVSEADISDERGSDPPKSKKRWTSEVSIDDSEKVEVAVAADTATMEFIKKALSKAEVSTAREYQAVIEMLVQTGKLMETETGTLRKIGFDV